MKLLFGLAALASVAFADITFNVVGYPSTSGGAFGVSVGGAITQLASDENNFPVWSGAVPGTDASVQYSYVELDSAGAAVKTEAFVRQHYNQTEVSTLNEFFERPTTEFEFPKVPYTYLATYPSKTQAFKQKQIATIHLTAPIASITELNANPKNDKNYKVDFRFINSKTVYSQRNITFSTSGKSSKDHSKQAFKLKFDTDFNQTFFSRPNIKLRSMVQDPTMIREKLYIDMLNSVGVPTQQGAWVRLFVNNEPYGLYLMVDDIQKSFLKQTVHGGNPQVVRGSLIQMNAWINKADLIYKGPSTTNYDPSTYVSQSLGNNPVNDHLKQLIGFMSELQSFDPAAAGAINFWNSTRLDLDGFLRSMALEYLMGGFDMYWMSGSNYFMYNNPTLAPGGKWQWIPTDMDNTFGSGFPSSTLPDYKTFVDAATAAERPLVQKLILNNPDINALFEQTLKEIVSTAFKPEALAPRAQAYHDMLKLDAEWDMSLTRKSPGTNNGFVFADFVTNLNTASADMQDGVLGWISKVSVLVSTQLNFAIPAGVANRVEPPARNGEEGNPEDEEDNTIEGEGPGSDNGGSGPGSAANTLFSKQAMALQGVVAAVVALAMMA
ncbi:hypothetical protein BG011_009706 [Mortierella polycephala]|uniref:Coth-domain-containing protein n=1 Tax=Mortierella polycephala TaxID=41804 RepID=A0A9P6QBP6_9FUNG|nr:hypothetical protein BG011_009706 [Mortierella polycephala]